MSVSLTNRPSTIGSAGGSSRAFPSRRLDFANLTFDTFEDFLCLSRLKLNSIEHTGSSKFQLHQILKPLHSAGKSCLGELDEFFGIMNLCRHRSPHCGDFVPFSTLKNVFGTYGLYENLDSLYA